MSADERPEPIAVIGMAARFPGARNVAEFWQNLLDGVNSIQFFEDDELREAGVREEELRDCNYVRAAPVIEKPEWLDAAFFGITPREAEALDPQQRVLLEISHTALQSAGYVPDTFDGRIGIYAGSRNSDYLERNVHANRRFMEAVGGVTAAVSNHIDYVATSVAYRLNLRGPALSAVTACSTSLVAVHLACNALRGSECEMALAGGVEIPLPTPHGYIYNEGGFTSPDGQIRPFDASARGTVFGAGAGVVVLRRLSDAVENGDPIHAVILGSAISNDGSGKSAFTAPTEEGQVAAIESALDVSGVPPETVSFVEAHGTATIIGDPMEVSALSRVYGRYTGTAGTCALASVKGNVGHLGAAAGVCGLIKAIHCVREGVLPASLGFEEPNPRIHFETTPFYVNRELAKWDSAGPRRAGISAFGVGGTNAHIVIEQPPSPRPSAPPRRPYQLFTLSARTPEALDAAAAELGEYLTSGPRDLADAAFTLNVGRAGFAARRTAVALSAESAAERLAGQDGGPTTTMVPRGVTREVAFLFPGQGAQHPGMARRLYADEPTFTAHIDRFARVLASSGGPDLLTLLFAGTDDDEAAALRLARTEAAQPALFAVEYALAMLLREWGVEPSAMVGHSVGEYVAACLADVMDPADALRLVAARGALVQSLPTGSMLAVMLPEELLRSMLTDELEIAAVNSPEMCVISGPHDSIRQMKETLALQGIATHPLHTSHAFHSRVLDPVLGTFREMVAKVPMSPPTIPYMSNVTGTWVTAEDVTSPDYWVRQLRGTVRFSESLRPLIDQGRYVFLEAGPGSTLSGLVRAHATPGGGPALVAAAAMRRPQEDRDDVEVALESVGRIWAAGARIDWDRFWAPERRRRVPLPTYPYERKRFWVEPETAERAEPVTEDRGPFYVPAWKETAIPADPPPASLDEETLWMVFHHPGCRPVERLVDRVREAGGRVLTVTPAEKFTRDNGQYEIRVTEEEDYSRLIEDVIAAGPTRVRVVHAWGVGDRVPADAHFPRQEGQLDLGFLSALAIVQATSRASGNLPIDLCLVTSDMQDVVGDGQIEPAKSTVLGLVRVMPKEFEDITSRSVDIALDAPVEQISEQLYTELTLDSGDRLVAYRGRKRWIWSYTSIPVEPQEEPPPALKQHGVYLITGGLGGLGLTVARLLGERLAARLVLAGRTGLPDRSDWPAILAGTPKDDRLARQIRGVMEVEEAGAQVLICAADAADETRMREVRAETERVFGPIDGIFHLAGLEGGALIETRTRADVRGVFRPKVAAPYVLDRVFDPELMVLYSSIAAITGELGQGDYAGANAAMDAYAQVQRSRGRNVVAINWPPWTQTGMARESNGPALLTDLGLGMETTACSSHPLLGDRREQRHGARDYVAFDIDLTPTTWVLDEHRLTENPVNRLSGPTIPATGIMELACATYRELTGSVTTEIRDLTFLRPLTAEPGLDARAELVRTGDGAFDFRVTGRLPGGTPVEYARCRLNPVGVAMPAHHRDLAVVRRACPDETSDLCHHPIAVDTGPRWDSIARRISGPGLDLVTLQLPDEFADDANDFIIHPATLDNATALGMRLPAGRAYLPLSYDRFTLRRPLPSRFHSIIRYVDGEVDPERDLVRADATLVDDEGAVLAEIEGMTLVKMDPDRTAAPSAPAGSFGGGTNEIMDLDSSDLSYDITFVYGREDNRDSGISTKDAGSALLAILARPFLGPQVILCPGGLEERARRVGRITRMALTKALTERSITPAGAVSNRSLDTVYEAPETEVERTLAELWQDTFGLDQVGVTDDFQELGGNSLLAVQLVARVSSRLGVNVTVAQLFEARNIRRLAASVGQATSR